MEMSSIHAVLVFALVAAGRFTHVLALESCLSADDDCHGQVKTAWDTVKSRWNMSGFGLIQDLNQFRVSCKKLMSKVDSL